MQAGGYRTGLSKPVLMGGGGGIVKGSLVAGYKFDEGAGQVLTDFTGRYPGQLGSAAGADDNDPTWGTTGLYFTTNDYIRAGAITDFAYPVYTVIAVFNADDNNATNGNILCKHNAISTGAGNTGFYLQKTSSGKVMLYQFASDAGGTRADCTIGNYSASTWYFVAGLCNGTSTYGFLGTTKSSSAALTDTAAPNTSHAMTFGRRAYTTSSYLEGHIAYSLIYNRVLSDAEVLKNYYYLKSYLSGRGIALA